MWSLLLFLLPVVAQGQEYASPLLGATIRVPAGAARPEVAERLVMPLLAANAGKLRGKRVLDAATDSGILALQAAKLGASKVVAAGDARALECLADNARRLGLEGIVEPRPAPILRPGETFDVILLAPDESSDQVPIGLEVTGALRHALSREGVAVLAYRYAVAHTLMVNYARRQGFTVENHPPLKISNREFHALYNTFAAGVARTEKLDPKVVFLPPPRDAPIDRGVSGGYYRVNFSVEKGVAFPPLWDAQLDRVLPGLIVVRRYEPK